MRKLSTVVLFFLVAGSPIVLSQQENTGRDRPSDAELRALVRAALVDDEATNAQQINVSRVEFACLS